MSEYKEEEINVLNIFSMLFTKHLIMVFNLTKPLHK